MTTREIDDLLVYPQDRGTTENHPHPGDPHSAAMKAAYGEALRGLDFVASGFGITVTDGSVDIDSGKAILTADSAAVDGRTDIEFGSEQLSDVAFLAHATSGETGISLETASGTNHVYLVINMDENNTGEFQVLTEETDGLGDISIKIGEVDGGSEDVDLVNRNDAVEEHQANGVHDEPQPPEDHIHDADEVDGVASDDDLDAHESDTDNPHSVALEQARSEDNQLGGRLESSVSSNDFWVLRDGSDGSNDTAFTWRFDDRDIRFFAGGDDGASDVLEIDHDTGVVNAPNGYTVDGNDVAIDGDTQPPETHGDDAHETRPMAKLALDTDQSIAMDELEQIEFDVVEIDTMDGADATNSTVTVPENGIYQIHSQARFNNGQTDDELALVIRANGDAQSYSYYQLGTDGRSVVTISNLVELNEGDEVLIEARNDGRDDEISGSFGYMTHFEVIKQ